MEGWRPNPARSNWTVEKLKLEFRCRETSNSGIFLRGRYEVSIEEGFTSANPVHQLGGIYGFVAPKTAPAQRLGQWRSLEAALVGRYVTVVLDGDTVMDGEEIPGPTGGALNGDEALPGPLLIQGDHGPVEFRNVVITPARKP
jgi:hypothetical protein